MILVFEPNFANVLPYFFLFSHLFPCVSRIVLPCVPKGTNGATSRDNCVATGAFTVEADREVVTNLAQTAVDSAPDLGWLPIGTTMLWTQ